MPDDNRFSGLGDKLGEGETEDDTDEESATPTESEPAPEPEPEPEPQRGIEYPAFDFADAKQGPIYARPESWEAFEDALELDVERALRKEYDVRNASKREIHDALLRLGEEQPERLAELVVEARKI